MKAVICLYFQPTTAEVNGFIGAFKSPSETRERGVKMGEETFVCYRADKFSIYAKQVGISLCF